MRELFDEVAGKSPVDPEEAVRRTTRAPQRKRFYAEAGVVDTPAAINRIAERQMDLSAAGEETTEYLTSVLELHERD